MMNDVQLATRPNLQTAQSTGSNRSINETNDHFHNIQVLRSGQSQPIAQLSPTPRAESVEGMQFPIRNQRLAATAIATCVAAPITALTSFMFSAIEQQRAADTDINWSGVFSTSAISTLAVSGMFALTGSAWAIAGAIQDVLNQQLSSVQEQANGVQPDQIQTALDQTETSFNESDFEDIVILQPGVDVSQDSCEAMHYLAIGRRSSMG